LVGAVGGKGASGEDQFHGDVAGEGPRQPEESSCVSHKGTSDLREPEAGLGSGDHQVAREDDLGAASQGRALHGGNQRLGALSPNDSSEAASFRGKASCTGGHGLEVGSCAEGRSVAGKDGDPGTVVLLEAVDGCLDGVGHLLVNRVAGFGAVQGEDGHPAHGVVGNRHGTTLSSDLSGLWIGVQDRGRPRRPRRGGVGSTPNDAAIDGTLIETRFTTSRSCSVGSIGNPAGVTR